jgi:hypothetical protein
MNRTPLVLLGVTLIGAAVLAHAALAWGEPKNQPPFTRQVAAQRSVETAARAVHTDLRGEPKNQLPFTRRVAP